ncbi:MAG TPA: ribosome biogenesis GTPase RsgA, partial [Porticoccaceae bacterium]|nr:ribosome biogenesis GTPase RsgA [Porticoccaceae bacterium]
AKGRHTTTTTDLYTLANDGRIIDSPGVREFGLLHLNEADLANGFIEFRDFLGQCRFRNCSHRDDPGCALEQACQNGLISDARLKSFRDIRESLHLT